MCSVATFMLLHKLFDGFQVLFWHFFSYPFKALSSSPPWSLDVGRQARKFNWSDTLYEDNNLLGCIAVGSCDGVACDAGESSGG